MTTTILIAIAAFLIITLVLVALLLYAKAKLTTSGAVTIDINNGEKVITTESGSTLLSTLANNKVFLPSACGGGGSCGMCKCQVLEGGGDILPTETGFITRKMAKDHWRLGCQVKVKNDLKIRVPEAVLGVKKWECTVVSNRNISTFLKEFVVKLPEGENLKFRSGGYIQIDIPKYDAIKFSDMDVDEKFRADWDKMKMWDLVTTNPEPTFRAYSMANHPAEGNIIMLNIRIATPPFDRATGSFMKVNPGICSSYIFSRKPGDKVTISGPYGEFFLPDNLPDTQELIFIGGGAGMAPMRSHIMHLFKTEKTKRPVSFWYGARAMKEAPYLHEFHEIEEQFPNFKFNLALDRPDPEADAAGVPYTPGFVHNVLYENYLKHHQAPEDCIYLMCGPPMMIASVVKMLDSLGVSPVAAFLAFVLFLLGGVWVYLGIDGYVAVSGLDPAGPANPLAKTVEIREGAWFANYGACPVLWALPALGLLGTLASALLVRKGAAGKAIVASGVAMLGIILTPLGAMFPFVMPSSVMPNAGLTLWDCTSSQLTLEVMFFVTLILLPLVLCYTAWAYKVMSGKLTAEYIEKNTHSLY